MMSRHRGQHGYGCGMEVLTANAKMLCLPADPSHREQPGAEEVINGSGYLHEDGRLPLHCHLLRGTFPRGKASWRSAVLPLGDWILSQALNSHA